MWAGKAGPLHEVGSEIEGAFDVGVLRDESHRWDMALRANKDLEARGVLSPFHAFCLPRGVGRCFMSGPERRYDQLNVRDWHVVDAHPPSQPVSASVGLQRFS